MDDYVKIFIAAVLGSIGAILGFRPRLKRTETDIKELKKDKLNKETFTAVKDHIDNKFKGQDHWLESIDKKLDSVVSIVHGKKD